MLKLDTPLGNINKLSPKFKVPYKVVATDSGNKFKIRHLETGDISVSHADELKKTNMNEFDGSSCSYPWSKSTCLHNDLGCHRQKAPGGQERNQREGFAVRNEEKLWRRNRRRVG